MSSTIKIKRSGTAGGPASLTVGELAYSYLAGDVSNGGDRLYIGTGTGGAGSFDVIGGKYFTSMLSQTKGVLTASSALVVDASSKIDIINVGGVTITGSTNVISTTVTNANLVLTPNGTGKVSIAGAFTLPRTDGTANQVLQTNGSGVVSWSTVTSGSATLYVGTTLTQTVSANQAMTGILSIDMSGSTSGTTTLIPSAIAGTTTITLPAISGTVITTGDTGTVTNTMLAGSIANAKLLNSSVTIGSTAVALGATVTTFAGLTSVTSTTFVGALTGNASTASKLVAAVNINGVAFDGSAAITVTAAALTLTGTQLNTAIVTSSLSTVGTITSGIWNGTAVAVGFGGTGTATGSITGTGALSFTAGGTNTNVNLIPNGTGTVDVASKRITNLADPSGAQDAASKNYVDTVASGINAHQSVKAATTGTLTSLTGSGTVTYANGTAGVGATLTLGTALTQLDTSYTLVPGDRILVKNEATTANNGIYIYTSSTVLTRASDFDTTAEIGGGDFIFVTSGTTLGGTGWVNTTKSVTIGTTPVTFSQFSGAGTYLAGTGLTLTGSTFSITNTAVTPASYGVAASVPQFTVNAQGQITLAANVAIAIAASQVTSGTLAIAQGGTNSNATATAGGVGYGTGTAHAYTTAGTAGQFLVSNGAAAPSWTALSASVVTTFSGGSTGLLPSAATSGAVSLSGTLATGYGGTGLVSYTIGDMIYASATNTLLQLAKPAATSLLTMTAAGAPSWVALTATGITGVGTLTAGTWNATAITVGYGGTGATTLAAKGVVIGNGTGTVTTSVSANGSNAATTSYGILTTDASNNPVWTDVLDGGTY
ncbi:hypothetical protein UFOVP58_133 [uncultured Caudovirales phage]|uniref:Major tropism determinant N-terminal domain-containing protein n=1 Tax=uncultured Caudovirales phage TaxID=2100421 RepID=A0A6J5KW14_9CAUD|nr:hypothetical protein UFOVP58_133 [uncultured Caudovirales phage]